MSVQAGLVRCIIIAAKPSPLTLPHHVRPNEYHPPARVLRATPAKVYRAFFDADALNKWMAPFGFVAKVQHLDARVGGTFRMSITNFGTGASHSFGGEYLELVPNERLRYTVKFDDPNLPGTMTTSVTLK